MYWYVLENGLYDSFEELLYKAVKNNFKGLNI